MVIVPVQALPSQVVNVALGGQDVTLNIYQKSTGLFMDVLVGGVALLYGVICENLNPVVRSTYLGFVGDLAWLDTQGADDPLYAGLGARWVLAYFSPSDLPPNLFPGVS